ncbi:hypothetical protein HDU93_009468, partial [Gonapodya sp. JEL0774]
SGFECVEYQGKFVWTALKTSVTVTHSRAAETPLEHFDALLVDLICIASLKSGAKLPRQDLLKVVVNEVRFHLEPDVASFDGEDALMRKEGQAALESLIRFAGKTQVRAFALHGASLDALSELGPDVMADSVERLTADNNTDAKWHRNLPSLLQVFPHASDVRCSAFYPKNTKLMSWCDMESPAFAARRASITSLNRAFSRDLDLLELLATYPNLHNLRSISMYPVLHSSQQVTPDINFPSLEVLHVFLNSIALEVAALLGRELNMASEFASVIHHLFPNLLELHIEYSVRSQNALATLEAFLGEIFRAAPSRCRVRVVPFSRQEHIF